MHGIENVTKLSDMIEIGLRKSRKLKEVYIKVHWKDIVGNLSTKSFPKELKNRVLIVVCESNTLIHYMNLNKGIYIEKINSIIKEKYIEDLRFLTGSLRETEMKLFGGNDG